MRIFDRNIRVTIRDVVVIENLVIHIDLKKEASSAPSEGSIMIYNLSESTETLIREAGEQIRVEVGYGNELSVIYDGQIRRVDKDRSTLDRVTKIEVGGNADIVTNARFNRGYEGSIPTRLIVNDIVATFNLTPSPVDIIPADARLQDFVYSGRSTDALDEILQPLNIYWFEDDGVIRLSKVGREVVSDTVVLSATTGLIGSPSITEDGIKFKSVMNAAIVVGGVIQIDSMVLTEAASGGDMSQRANEYQGRYKVTQLTRRGDNWMGEFVTEGIASELTEDE